MGVPSVRFSSYAKFPWACVQLRGLIILEQL